MVLKLFTPTEAKAQNSAQNTRDVLRTREIRKLVDKSHTDLAKHEADFAAMLARHKQKWAEEEEAHSIRLVEMEMEILPLEDRRKNALIPIELEKRKADTMIIEAENRLGEVEKREKEADSLENVLIERISQVSERESAVEADEAKAAEMLRSAALEKETAALNTKTLSEGIQKFNDYVLTETLILDGKRTEITLKERSIEAREAALDRKDKSLATRETQIKDKQETLARAFEEFRKNKMENTENTGTDTAELADSSTASGTAPAEAPMAANESTSTETAPETPAESAA